MSRFTLIFILFALCATSMASSVAGVQPTAKPAEPSNLPLPSSMPLQDYEQVLYQWLMTRQYQALNWRADSGVRDTGPYINGQYYGTHPAVRIHYSPEVITWLQGGRVGELPDGSMIIKEMFRPPAVLYQDMANNPRYKNREDYQAFLRNMVFAWTVMVRDKTASKDGWFWANPAAPNQTQTIAQAIAAQLDNLTTAPGSEFGAPCLRCHASAEKQFTFSDVKNIEGLSEGKESLRFLVDTSWRSAAHFDAFPLSTLKDDPYVQQHFMLPDLLRPFMPSAADAAKNGNLHSGVNQATSTQIANAEALPDFNPAFIATFPIPQVMAENKVLRFPSQWTDQVLPDSHQAQQYLTSDNCLGCHGGLGGQPYGVTMFVNTGPNYGDGFNLSEYGEWRWSPMGLAGRDPIFHAQLESEMVYLEQDAKRIPTPLKASLQETKNAVNNTCLSCHGAMGQRQLEIDAAQNKALDPNMKVDYFYLQDRLSSKQDPHADAQYVKYGKLAREGVSCAICHHIDKPSDQAIAAWTPQADWLTPLTNKDLAYALFHNSTGRFVSGPADQFFGPYADVAVLPMQNSLGVTPTHNSFVSDSLLCGTCHTINLPNIGATKVESPVLNAAETNPAFQGYQHSIEQATFLEWQNSAFAQNKGVKDSKFASCQDCHMPGSFETLNGDIKIDQITTQIAAIQDTNFPEADNRLPNKDIAIPLRNDYKRHEHVGLNVFLLEMFDQFPNILGVAKTDYMTSAKNGVDTAIENMIRQAQNKTASIALSVDSVVGNKLKASVKLRNLSGHRFPSGVAFRRAFIELSVFDVETVVWSSGSTNEVGVILDGQGKPLPSEFLPNGKTFQPHYQTITAQNQVQIYEELNQDAQGEFTTSFIHRVHDIKDNRLLPDGWRASINFAKDGKVLQEFMQATDPKGTGNDPDYMDHGANFFGGDSVAYDIELPTGLNTENLQVRATLYSQSIPPSWLHQRFTTAPNAPATQRLHYIASRLNLKDTPMQNWKLKLVSDCKSLSQKAEPSKTCVDSTQHAN